MVTTRVLVDAVTFAASVGLLWIGAELFVSNATRVARRFGLSELVIGLTVVAVGTSAPEVAVSVDAALVGNGDIALANVIGSNLFNIGLVLGGIAVATGVRSSRQMVRRDGAVMVGSTLLVLVFLRDLRLGRAEGVVFLLSFATYLLVLLVRREGGEAGTDPDGRGAPTRLTPVLLAVGLGAVVVGAHFLVEAAVSLARVGGLSEWVIGETIVAVGTSTPEIVASVSAARRGMGDVAAGNLIGSNVFNALLILGITATLNPIRVAEAAVGTTAWLLGLSALTAALLGTKGRLGRIEGAALVTITLGRWALDLL